MYVMNYKICAYFFVVIGLLFGCSSAGRFVAEPSRTPSLRDLYLKDKRSQRVMVAFEASDSDVNCAVTHVNLIGETTSLATFCAGGIVARELGNVVRSNFHVVSGDEKPVATIHVGIARTRAKVVRSKVEADVAISVKINEINYSKTFEGKATDAWRDENAVPMAFYSALESAISNFILDCNTSGTVKDLLCLRNCVVPPSSKPIKWKQCGYVWEGTCSIDCNDYGLDDAKLWAYDFIFEKCWSQLDRINREEVRIVYYYDGAEFIGNNQILCFSFRAFKRREMVYHYDSMNNSGFIIGDMELMGVSDEDDAKLDLEEVAEKQVRKDAPEKSLIFIGKPEVDEKYKLMTIRFNLVGAP